MSAQSKVLVIDDEDAARYGISRALGDQNYELEEAANGMEALEIKDIYTGLIKSVVFAVVIVTVGCGQGMKASGGAEGVGNATRNTVVISLILIIAFNYFITSLARWIT